MGQAWIEDAQVMLAWDEGDTRFTIGFGLENLDKFIVMLQDLRTDLFVALQQQEEKNCGTD